MRIVCLVVLFAGAAWGQWEPFRGPNGTGVSDSPGVPVEFGTAKNMMWCVELLAGRSSPVIGAGRFYLTAVERGFTHSGDRC